MKSKALVAAIALACGAAAFAQSTGPGAAATSTDTQPAAVHKAKVASHHAKSKARRAMKHAGASTDAAMARHHARMHGEDRPAMGAAMASPAGDMHAASRQDRMDSAYADWTRGRK